MRVMRTTRTSAMPALAAAAALCTGGWALAADDVTTSTSGSSMITSGLQARPFTQGGIAGQPCGDGSITQSTDPDTLVAGTVQCAVAGAHTVENGLARSFALGSDAAVCGVQFGIETNTGGAWDVTINLYEGDINGVFDNLELRGSSTVSIPDGANLEFFTAFFDPPVEFAAGENMIVELFNPSRDPAVGGDGGALWPGSNNLGETDPSYIRSVDCGIPNFSPYSAIGFPDVHLAYEVYLGGGAACVGDLDDSGEVDGADLALLLGAWGPCDDPDDCVGDLDGSTEVDGADLALLLGNWGECPEPPAPLGACCLGEEQCDLLTEQECLTAGGEYQGNFSNCTACEEPEPDPDCCEAQPGQKGCNVPDCEAAVCDQLPFCCSFEWDDECATLANEICEACAGPVQCQVDCPAGALDEGEACGTDTNGGCNASPPIFGAVECGDIICGTAWADAGTRDTDFFEITVDATTDVTADMTSQFPGVVAFFQIDDPCTATFIGTFGHSDEDCSTGTATATLEPGLTYSLFVSAGLANGGGVFEGFPCGGGANDYTVTLSCE